jgi:hypothetical protein
MKSQTRFVTDRMFCRTIVSSFTILLALILAAPLSPQDCPVNVGVRTICKQIGNAKAVSVTSPSGAYPALQPVVYWHDDEWMIDMLPQPTSDGEVRMKISSQGGDIKVVNLPGIFAQVDSIVRNLGDKALIVAEANGTAEAFLIADLRLGKLIDRVGMYHPSISPDRRFILYINGYPAHGDVGAATQYRIYDTLRTPRENTCGYRQNDPEHLDLDETYRGFPIYPRKANQVNCSDADDEAFAEEDHDMASDFIWSTDSSKVVFADIQGGAINLVQVTMPTGTKGIPQTSTHRLVGAEDVCSGAANCDHNNVRSIAWNGDTVNVALIQANPTGKAIEKDITIPLSKFVPIGK